VKDARNDGGTAVRQCVPIGPEQAGGLQKVDRVVRSKKLQKIMAELPNVPIMHEVVRKEPDGIVRWQKSPSSQTQLSDDFRGN
jgi:hypothetical protein